MKRAKNTKLFYSIEGLDWEEILKNHDYIKNETKIREEFKKTNSEIADLFDEGTPSKRRTIRNYRTPLNKTLRKKYEFFIHNLISRQISSDNGIAYLSRDILKKVFDRDYFVIKINLIRKGIIATDGYYDIDTKPYGFWVMPDKKITTSTVSIYYPDEHYCKTLNKLLQKNTDNYTAQAKENLSDGFYNSYKQSLSKLKLQFKDEANKFIDIHFTNSNNSKLYYQYIIEQFYIHNFDIKVPNTNDNRIYHILTTTPRLLKYFTNIKFSVDIHNSHPLLFVDMIYNHYKVPTEYRYLISQYIIEINPINNRYNAVERLYNKLKENNIDYPKIKDIPLDVIRYIYLVSTGQFWDKVLPDLNEPQEGKKYNIIRQDVKVIMFAQVFYGKQLTSRGQEYAKVFKKKFPNVYSIILSFKRGLDKNERTVLTHKLMALESRLFREVLRRLYELKYSVISIHDAVVVLDVKENNDCTPVVVKEIITNVYNELGLIPDCSVDYYGKEEMEVFLEKEKFLREKGDELISELRVLAEEDEEIQQLISDYDNGKSEIVLTPDKQDVMLHLRDTKDLMYRQ